MRSALRHLILSLSVLVVVFGLAHAQPPATESGFVYVEDDVRLYYQRYGTGTPRLFIPNRHELIPGLAELLYSNDVVLWDTRGRGLSDRPDDIARYGIDAELADAEALRRHFGAERVVYVGISLWGNIALLYAARHPESVAGVVALSPLPAAVYQFADPIDPPWHDVEAQIAQMEAMREGVEDLREVSEPYRHCLLDYYVGFTANYTTLEAFRSFEAANVCQYINERPGWLGLVIDGIFNTFGEWDWLDEYATIQAPALIVYGSREHWDTEPLRALGDMLPNAGVFEVTGASHHLWNERSTLVAGLLTEFARGRWPEGVSR